MELSVVLGLESLHSPGERRSNRLAPHERIVAEAVLVERHAAADDEADVGRKA